MLTRRGVLSLSAGGVLLAARSGHAAGLNDRLTGDLTPVHDPCIAKEQGVYYVYATSEPGSGLYLTLHTSTDLVKWSYRGSIFKTIPDWVRAAVPKTQECWAPDVSFFGGKWRMYYAYSSWGSNQSVIGMATSPTLDPEGPGYGWTDEGLVMASHKSDDFNAIDPNHVVDAYGRHWLVFGSFWTGIKMRRLDPASGRVLAGDHRIYSLAKRPSPWFAPGAIEAPFLIRRGDWYYLFASYDYCCRGAASTYYVAYGRAKAIEGPYLAREGGSMLDGVGTVLLRGDLEEHGRFRGPGHCAILQDGARDYVVYHAYDAQNAGASTLRVAELSWSADGWPTALV